MNIRELKDNSGAVFSPKVSADSVYLTGSTTTLTTKLGTIPTKTSQLTNDSNFLSGQATDGNLVLNRFVKVENDGVAEIGRYLDFHLDESSNDFTFRFEAAEQNWINCTGEGIRAQTIELNSTVYPYGRVRLDIDGESGYVEISNQDLGKPGNSVHLDLYQNMFRVVKINSDGNVYVPFQVENTQVDCNSLYSAGQIICDGQVSAKNGFYVSSSRTVKENIKPTTINGEDMVNSVDVVDFTYKTDEHHNPKIGFIAEDTDPLLSTPEQKRMDFSNCIGVMMKAIQELSAKVRTLTDKLESLTPLIFLRLLIPKKSPSRFINSKLILKEVA